MHRSKYLLKILLFSVGLLFFTTSCQHTVLRMQVDNISRESLASHQIGTPDPRLIYPPVGQRMILSWYIPSEKFHSEEMKIRIAIIYGNHTEEEIWLKPRKAYGMYVKAFLNEEYFEKCGILTYKSEIYSCDKVIKEWRHHLWTTLISFPEEALTDACAHIF